MKNARIIMAMLMLLGAATLVEAQIVVSSTTASTVRQRPKSGREKGLVLRPDIEYGVGAVEFGMGINCTADYQFNPIFSVGGGIGCNYEFYWAECVSKPISMPIFANARLYFCDRKWSPFFDLKLGYYIPIVKGERVVSYYNYSHTVYGFSIGGTIGIQYKNFEFGLSARTVKVHRAEFFSNYCNDYGNSLSGMIRLTFAYNFQFKKK